MNRSKNNIAAKQKKRRLWWIPVIVLSLCVIAGMIAIIGDAPSRQELASLTFSEIDFSRLNDGIYTATFTGTKGSLRDASLEVTISNGEITNIRIIMGAVDENGVPQEIGNGMTINDLFDTVLEQKTLQVDAVSGATLTSNAHLKALEVALLDAQRNPKQD